MTNFRTNLAMAMVAGMSIAPMSPPMRERATVSAWEGGNEKRRVKHNPTRRKEIKGEPANAGSLPRKRKTKNRRKGK